jgi:3-phosphoshikimate 1-carboxyvinyltransferase
MNVKIQPGRLSGTIPAIPSKSQAHRALICAALADGPTRINCSNESEDIAATIECLSALGTDIRRETDNNGVNSFTVIPLNKKSCENDTPLPCGESGSTFRFLLPIVGALGCGASYLLKGQLPKRPLSPLDSELTSHGCTLSPHGTVPFRITGQLKPGKYALDAGVSSQFISGLLFALPLLDKDSELRLLGKAESFPYIELTMAMLQLFGIQIAFNDEVFSIPGKQSYHSPGELNVEGCWSNAAFWLSAGAIGTDTVACTGLDLQSRQGDRAVLDILGRFGSRLETDGDKAAVSGGKLRGIEIDAKNTPDLVPILAVIGTAAEGTTVIRNAQRLRIKESDRLAAVTGVLRSLGANITEKEDGLVIQGSTLTGGDVSSWGDHRIAMAAAIAATVCSGTVIIRGAEAVNKSYPFFFNDLSKLGGSVQIIG